MSSKKIDETLPKEFLADADVVEEFNLQCKEEDDIFSCKGTIKYIDKKGRVREGLLTIEAKEGQFSYRYRRVK